MFILSRVGALDIAKGRVILHNSRRNQVVQLSLLASMSHIWTSSLTYAQKVLVLAKAVNVPATEGKSAKVLVDQIQQVLGRGKT